MHSEFNRIKRTLLILFFGCFLVFLTLNLTTFLKSYIDINYAHQEVLMPVSKGSHVPTLDLSYTLLHEQDLIQLKQKYEGLNLYYATPTSQIDMTILNTNQTLSLSLCYREHYDEAYMNGTAMEMYGLEIGDFLQLESLLIEIHGVSYSNDCDLILPREYATDHIHIYDNLLHIEYNQDIDVVLNDINTILQTSPFFYQQQNFSMDDLLLGMINLLEKVLLSFGFVIFLVSASNLGTLMPYFIHEFKDEITVLKHLGLHTRYLTYIFMLVCFSMLMLALGASGLVGCILFKCLGFILNVHFKIPLIKTGLLIIVQSLSGLLSSYQSIKKATESVTY